MSLSPPISGLHDARHLLAFLSLFTDLAIALVLTLSKTAARRATVPLTAFAIVLAVVATFNLFKAPRPRTAQPVAIFFPDPPAPSAATRFRRI